MDTANESQVYARALYPLGHGCALWIPEPNDALSAQYRETGVRIGDIGILTPDGGFDFIFNVCCSADDPINQYGVPEGFQPLAWDGGRFERANRFRPGVPLCSRDTKQWDLSVGGVASLPGFPAGAGGGIGIQFRRERGAVLMPPKGANRVDCHNLSVFREYAERNYSYWYQFLNATLGREAENGAIYFITGFDKTDCWENAVAYNTSNKQSCELIFTTGGLGSESYLKLSRSSILQSSVSSRYSVENSRPNQALFIRGFRVSIRRGIRSVWRRGAAEIVSTYNASWRDSLGKKDGDPPFSRGRPPSSGSELSQSSSVAGTSEGSFKWQDELLSSPTERFNYHHVNGSDTSFEEEDFIPTMGAYHPLDVINEHILQSRRDAEVVITHDNDLVALLQREDTELPDDRVLIGRLQDQLQIKVKEGRAYLTRQSRPLYSASLNPSPSTSDQFCNNQADKRHGHFQTSEESRPQSRAPQAVSNDIGNLQPEENPFFYSPGSPAASTPEEPGLDQAELRPFTCYPVFSTRTGNADELVPEVDSRPQTAVPNVNYKRKLLYLCDVEGCDSPGFAERSELVYHMISSHQAIGKPYQCSRCQNSFTRRHDLTLHLRSGECLRGTSPVPKRVRFDGAIDDATRMRVAHRLRH